MKKLKVAVTVILLIIIVGVGVVLSVAPAMVEKSMNKVMEHAPYNISQAAQKKHSELIIMDWHSDSLLWNRDLLKRSNYGHMDIPRLLTQGVGFAINCSRRKGQP